MTPVRGENLWPPLQKWNDDSYLQENQELKTTCSSCNLGQVSLKSGLFTGDSKGSKSAMTS